MTRPLKVRVVLSRKAKAVSLTSDDLARALTDYALGRTNTPPAIRLNTIKEAS